VVGQGEEQEDVRVGAPGHRDRLPGEIFDAVDPAPPVGHQGRPLRPGVGVDRLDRAAVYAGEQSSCPGRRAELDAPGIEELDRLVAPGRLHPLHFDTGQLLFEPSIVFEHEAHRVVVGPVDSDLVDGRLAAIAAVAARGGDHDEGQK
jgi:hypothetical protein